MKQKLLNKKKVSILFFKKISQVFVIQILLFFKISPKIVSISTFLHHKFLFRHKRFYFSVILLFFIHSCRKVFPKIFLQESKLISQTTTHSFPRPNSELHSLLVSQTFWIRDNEDFFVSFALNYHPSYPLLVNHVAVLFTDKTKLVYLAMHVHWIWLIWGGCMIYDADFIASPLQK